MDVRYCKNGCLTFWMSHVANGCQTFWMSHFDNGCHLFQKWISDISKMDVTQFGCRMSKMDFRHFGCHRVTLRKWMSTISKMEVTFQEWMSNIQKFRHFWCHMSPMDVRHYAWWHHHSHCYLLHAEMGDCMCTVETRARQHTTRLEWRFIKHVQQLFTIGVTTHNPDT